jgi:ribonuclease P protein component
MLSKKNRLTEEKDFVRVQADGKVYQSANFGIAVADRNDSGPSRFAFIVSNKIAKEAVDRNRIKRVMSEVIRLNVTNIRDGLDVVFLAKPSITRVPTTEIMKEVKESLEKNKLFK